MPPSATPPHSWAAELRTVGEAWLKRADNITEVERVIEDRRPFEAARSHINAAANALIRSWGQLEVLNRTQTRDVEGELEAQLAIAKDNINKAQRRMIDHVVASCRSIIRHPTEGLEIVYKQSTIEAVASDYFDIRSYVNRITDEAENGNKDLTKQDAIYNHLEHDELPTMLKAHLRLSIVKSKAEIQHRSEKRIEDQLAQLTASHTALQANYDDLSGKHTSMVRSASHSNRLAWVFGIIGVVSFVLSGWMYYHPYQASSGNADVGAAVKSATDTPTPPRGTASASSPSIPTPAASAETNKTPPKKGDPVQPAQKEADAAPSPAVTPSTPTPEPQK